MQLVTGEIDEPLFGRRGLYMESSRTNMVSMNIFDPNIQFFNIAGVGYTDGPGLQAALRLRPSFEAPASQPASISYTAGENLLSFRTWIRLHAPKDKRAIPAILCGTFYGSDFVLLRWTPENDGEWIPISGVQKKGSGQSFALLFGFYDYANRGIGGGMGFLTNDDYFDLSGGLHAESVYKPPGQIVLNDAGEPVTSAACNLHSEAVDVPDGNTPNTIAFRFFENGLTYEGSDWLDRCFVDNLLGIDSADRVVQVNDDGRIRATYGIGVTITSAAGLIKNGGVYKVTLTCDGTDFQLYVNDSLIGSAAIGVVTAGNYPLVFSGTDYELSDLNIYDAHADTIEKVKYALDD